MEICHKISIRSNPWNSSQSFIIGQSSKNRTSPRAVHSQSTVVVVVWRENTATTRAKFRNARDTISSSRRARKFPQTIANLPLNTERPTTTLAATLLNSTGGESMDAGGCFFHGRVFQDSTNRGSCFRSPRSFVKNLWKKKKGKMEPRG